MGAGPAACGRMPVLDSLAAGFDPSAMIWNIILAFAGNTIGVWRALRGKRAVTWDAPASARRVSLTLPTGGRRA